MRKRTFFPNLHRLPLLLPLILLAACASAETANPLLARRAYNDALQSSVAPESRKQMYAQLKEAIRLDPSEMDYRLALGSAYAADGIFDHAESEFAEILRQRPGFSEAHTSLGRLYMQQGKWQPAAFHLAEALKNRAISSPHQVHNWLALSYFSLNDFAAAENEWRKALSIKENASVRLNLALALVNRERFAEARESLASAIAQDPALAQAHYQLALLLLKEKDTSGARGHFQEVLRLEPQGELAANTREYLELTRAKN